MKSKFKFAVTFFILFSMLSCGFIFAAVQATESKDPDKNEPIFDWKLAELREAKVGDWKQYLEFIDNGPNKIITTYRETVTKKKHDVISRKVENSMPVPAGDPNFTEDRLNQPTTKLIQKGDIEGEQYFYFKSHKLKCHFVTKNHGIGFQDGQMISRQSTF